VSVEGLARALEGALELHQQYPKNKAELAGRKGAAPEFASPEKYPLLKNKYGPKLNYEANVAQSCIHCHQIGDAQRQLYRDRKQPIPEEVLFPYPHPKSLGLILDPKERATVLRVDKDSLTDKAGFQKGDAILRLEGQPVLSIADVQWVLHHTSPQGAALKAQLQRNGKTVELVLTLPRGWRHLDDISWRVSTWGLRRMVLGGMILEHLTAEERKTAGVGETGMALRVKFLGNNGPHGAAMRAGFLKGDVLIGFDARTDLLRETDVIAHALSNHQVGDHLPVTVLRDGKKLTLMLPMQE
jgi:S1-C subfamily serine protease